VRQHSRTFVSPPIPTQDQQNQDKNASLSKEKPEEQH